jgi:sigma-B regulation protein RsbU (phosphoserine phosphatase)
MLYSAQSVVLKSSIAQPLSCRGSNAALPAVSFDKQEAQSARILIADDQADVLEALRLLLRMEDYDVVTASSPQDVLSAVGRDVFDLALIDLNYHRDTTSGLEGLELLTRLRARNPFVPVVVMTAWGGIDLAVEAMRRGAVDFVTKPWDNAQLVATLRERMLERDGGRDEAAPGRVVQRDLRLARSVQERLLPRRVPRLSTLSCAACCMESGAVGGDLYDFLDLGAGRIGLVVADVSGKGMPAAIVMAHLNAMLRGLTPQMRDDLPLLAHQVNALLLEVAVLQYYVTIFLSVYDEKRRCLRYVNCGHVPPVLLRAGGEADWLSSTAPAVGLLEEFTAQQSEISIGAGDTLLIYTDGVTESTGRGGEEFGPERLVSFLKTQARTEPEVLVARLMQAREEFAEGEQRDDVTVLLARGRE